MQVYLLSRYRLSNCVQKIARISYAPTLTPFRKRRQNFEVCMNGKVTTLSRLLITEFLNKGWTKNSITRLLVMFGTVDRHLGSGRRRAHTDENVDTVESLLLSKEDKPQSHRTVREILHEAGGSIDHQFRGLFTKTCVSSAARKARSTAD